MQQNIHENLSENYQNQLPDKNVCQLCSANLNEVGGTNARFIFSSGTIHHLPMCFVCEVNLDYRQKSTLAAFARAMMSLVVSRIAPKGGAR